MLLEHMGSGSHCLFITSYIAMSGCVAWCFCERITNSFKYKSDSELDALGLF